MDFNHTYITASSQGTAHLGKELGNRVGNHQESGRIYCLFGELGSGKTTFAGGFARALGISTRLLSPTFTIVRRYPMLSHAGFLYHLDLYRTEGEKDLFGLGIQEILKDPDSIVLIEWAEKLGKLLPTNRVDVQFNVLEDGKRQVSICKMSQKKQSR